MRGSAPAPGGRTTPLTSAASGGIITISTPVASANGARTRSCRFKRGSGRDTSAIEYEHVDGATGDGLVAHYANGVKLILSLKHECWGSYSGQRFDGTEGWIANSGGEHDQSRASSPALLSEVQPVLDDYTARTQRPLNHTRDFLDCVKSRRETVAYPEAMHRAMTTVHAANICMWLQRDLKYDPVKEEFTGDAEANQLRARTMRAPWVAWRTSVTPNFIPRALRVLRGNSLHLPAAPTEQSGTSPQRNLLIVALSAGGFRLTATQRNSLVMILHQFKADSANSGGERRIGEDASFAGHTLGVGVCRSNELEWRPFFSAAPSASRLNDQP